MNRIRLLVFAAILFAIMLGVGLSAVQSSSYRDVCVVYQMRSPDSVVVAGNSTPLPNGIPIQVIVEDAKGGRMILEGNVENYYYIKARVVGGSLPQLSGDASYAVFVMRGRTCSKPVIAFFSVKTFTEKYDPRSFVGGEVVVEATAYPNLHAKILDWRGHVLYEGPVIVIKKILKGCHEAYTQTVVRPG